MSGEKLRKHLKENHVYGARVFHADRHDAFGLYGLPNQFVALHGDRLLIVGEPEPDVMQLALSEAGFDSLDVTKAPAGEGRNSLNGLLINLTV